MNLIKNIFEPKLPTYKQVIKCENKYIIGQSFLITQDDDLPTYEQVIFEEKREREELLKNLAPELVEDGPPRGTCNKCNMNVYKSWKKNPDGVLFHKYCFYN